ncbi:MAG: hypothetical protein R6U86_09545, partial [Bacteroidales bacterium]
REGRISAKSDHVVLLTGSGLKDLQAVRKGLPLPPSIEPGIEQLSGLYERFMNTDKSLNEPGKLTH